jgi:hypothetical protein
MFFVEVFSLHDFRCVDRWTHMEAARVWRLLNKRKMFSTFRKERKLDFYSRDLTSKCHLKFIAWEDFFAFEKFAIAKLFYLLRNWGRSNLLCIFKSSSKFRVSKPVCFVSIFHPKIINYSLWFDRFMKSSSIYNQIENFRILSIACFFQKLFKFFSSII